MLKSCIPDMIRGKTNFNLIFILLGFWNFGGWGRNKWKSAHNQQHLAECGRMYRKTWRISYNSPGNMTSGSTLININST